MNKIRIKHRELKRKAEALRHLENRTDYIWARRRLLQFQAKHEATLRKK